MSHPVVYHPLVVEQDIPQLPKSRKTVIKRAIEARLTTHPDLYGQPLRRSLKNYRKLRVGDYRVIFKLVGSEVRVLMIAHRSVVYSKVAKRVR